MQKKTVLKCCMMNDKKRISMLLKILDQISQGNEEARNGIEESLATICKEGISFEQVFHFILFYFILFLFIYLFFYFLFFIYFFFFIFYFFFLMLLINFPLASRVANLF